MAWHKNISHSSIGNDNNILEDMFTSAFINLGVSIAEIHMHDGCKNIRVVIFIILLVFSFIPLNLMATQFFLALCVCF